MSIETDETRRKGVRNLFLSRVIRFKPDGRETHAPNKQGFLEMKEMKKNTEKNDMDSSHTGFDHQFIKWLTDYFKKNEQEVNGHKINEQVVRKLLKDKTVVSFLITWSIFESRFFRGFVKVSNLEGFAKKVVANSGYDKEYFREAAEHFHMRYQDKKKYKNLKYLGEPGKYDNSKESKIVDEIINRKFDENDKEWMRLLLYVVYRYRNNIFHGNKDVNSWLNTYKEQIKLCISTIQTWISLTSDRNNNPTDSKSEDTVCLAY
ncbi:MAG: hypothetical protein JW828_05315 [Sedimentisphaerales bacterium]|nr:hypothetical protein [Sedimentisphaerales bacterium]